MPHAPWPFTWPAGSIHGSATSQKAYDVDSKPFDGGLHPHGKSEAVHRDQQGVPHSASLHAAFSSPVCQSFPALRSDNVEFARCRASSLCFHLALIDVRLTSKLDCSRSRSWRRCCGSVIYITLCFCLLGARCLTSPCHSQHPRFLSLPGNARPNLTPTQSVWLCWHSKAHLTDALMTGLMWS